MNHMCPFSFVASLTNSAADLPILIFVFSPKCMKSSCDEL